MGRGAAIKAACSTAVPECFSEIKIRGGAPNALRLRFGFFFAALGFALAVMSAVALLFSRIALYGISRRSVLDALSAEN